MEGGPAPHSNSYAFGSDQGGSIIGQQVSAYDVHPSDQGSDKSLRDILDVFIRRFGTIVGIWFLVFLCAFAYTSSLTAAYRSQATIEIEAIGKKIVPGVSGIDAFGDSLNPQGYFSTQLEILRSRGLAEDFVANSVLKDQPGLLLDHTSQAGVIFQRYRTVFSTLGRSESAAPPETGREDSGSRCVAALSRLVTIRQVGGTNLVEVSLEAPSPDAAQQLLQGYLELYLARNLEKRRDDHIKASVWLRDELAKVQQKLMKSEATLLEFITDNGIIAKDGGLGSVMDLVNRSLEGVRQSRQARVRIQASQEQEGPEGSGALPKGVTNEYLARLKQQLATIESEYSELKSLYSPTYPKMSLMSKKMDFLRQKIGELEKSAVSTALDQAKSDEKLFKDALDEAKKEATRLNALEAHYALLKKEVEADRQFYHMILKEYKEMEIRAGTVFNNISLVDPPRKPVSPVRPRTGLNLLVGALAGLMCGIIVAGIRESLDDTVRHPRDIDRELKVRRLAVVPDVARLARMQEIKGAKGQGFELLAHDHPRSPLADAIRNIQTSIFLSHPTDKIRTMIVSSAMPSEGKTLISISVATVLSSGSNRRTLLIDGDLRKPRIHKVFGHSECGLGFSTLLSGETTKLKDVVHAYRIPGFFYMTAGPVPDDPVSLLRSDRMDAVMAHLKKVFDYIVLDSPPVLGFSDTQILCRHTDGVVMVAKQGHVGREDLREAMNTLTRVQGGRILGVVLNKAHPRGGGYGYGGYYYYSRNYKHYYHARPKAKKGA